jgi:hypothetical protein
MGPPPREWGYTRIEGRWKLIAEGERFGVVRLAGDRAALLGFSDGEARNGELLLLRAGDARLTVVGNLLPRSGALSIPPAGQRVDCVVGEGGSIPDGYGRLILSSLDLDGRVGATQAVDAPDVDGRPGRFHSAIVSYYDRNANPYFRVRPEGAGWHGPWLVAGVFPEGLKSFPMPLAPSPAWRPDWRVIVGRELLEPKKFYPFPNSPVGPIPP